MAYLFFLVLILFVLYTIAKKPGVALSYLLLFQPLNKLIFDEVGLGALRYSTTLLIIVGVFFIHKDFRRFTVNVKNYLKNSVTIAYLILFIYMVIYALILGTNYEYTYLQRFVIPSAILFFVAATFFFNFQMYEELFKGIVIFSAVTFLAIYLFKDFNALMEAERSDLGALLGIGPLAQGNMAAIMIMLAYLLIIKGNLKFVGAGIIILGLYWLALSGTRGALLALAVALFIYSIRSGQLRKIFLRGVLLLLVLSPAFFLIDFESTPIVQRTLELSAQGGIETTTRFYRWLLFFEIFPDYFIFGAGPGGWGREVMIGEFRFPHNIIIETIIEFGIIGFIFFLTLFISSIKNISILLKSEQITLYMKGVSLIWVFYALAAMKSGSLLTNVELHTITGVVVGLSFYTKNKKLINQ